MNKGEAAMAGRCTPRMHEGINDEIAFEGACHWRCAVDWDG